MTPKVSDHESARKWQISPDQEVPHDFDGVRVVVMAHIRKNETGEVRQYHTEELLEKGEQYPSVFGWEDGNYCCDCNRSLFFGEPQDYCTDGRYSVNLENPATGEIYYREY